MSVHVRVGCVSGVCVCVLCCMFLLLCFVRVGVFECLVCVCFCGISLCRP